MLSKDKQEAVDFFLQKMPDHAFCDIKKIKKLSRGYTNFSFVITTKDDHHFHVRLARQNRTDLNRKNEWLILSTLNSMEFIYYDKENGNFIKKWIDGRHPKKKDWYHPLFLKNLFQEIEHIQRLSSNTQIHQQIPKLDFKFYLNDYHDEQKYLGLFKKLIPTDQNDLVLNHSDICPENILILNKNYNIKIIDFETACFAPKLWEYGNWLRSIKFRPKHFVKFNCERDFDLQKLLQFCYLTTFFAYCWAESMPRTRKIISYQKKTRQEMKKYFYLATNWK